MSDHRLNVYRLWRTARYHGMEGKLLELSPVEVLDLVAVARAAHAYAETLVNAPEEMPVLVEALANLSFEEDEGA